MVEEIIGEGGLIGIRLKTAEKVLAAFQNGPKNGIDFAKGGLDGSVLRLPLPVNATKALVDEASTRIAGVMRDISA